MGGIDEGLGALGIAAAEADGQGLRGALRFDLPSAGRSSGKTTATVAPAAVVSEAEMRLRERDNIKRALDLADGKVYGPGGAAELLGIKPNTLAARVKKLGL